MVAHYSKKRDQRLHARSAMEKRDERKVANSGTEQDNSSGKPFDN
jgi:hypothetical protein